MRRLYSSPKPYYSGAMRMLFVKNKNKNLDFISGLRNPYAHE
jgi:hypothetical protein